MKEIVYRDSDYVLENPKTKYSVYTVEYRTYLEHWSKNAKSRVRKGDAVGQLKRIWYHSIDGKLKEEISSEVFSIHSPHKGFFIPVLWNFGRHPISEGQELFKIYENKDELYHSYFEWNISKIELTGEYKINWELVDGRTNDYMRLCSGSPSFSLNIRNGKPVIFFRTETKYKVGSTLAVKFQVSFSKSIIKRYQITKKTHVFKNSAKDYETDFELTKADIDYFILHQATSFGIIFTDGREPEVFDVPSVFHGEMIQYFFKNFKNALLKIIEKSPAAVEFAEEAQPQTAKSKEMVIITSEPVYVYLMKDKANGYCKIGISNKPTFRERTLQSEKPTVEMLASHKYPSRAVASAIETALHTLYAESRVRGEWFNLTPEDEAVVIATLE